jgi:hypothetical protein
MSKPPVFEVRSSHGPAQWLQIAIGVFVGFMLTDVVLNAVQAERERRQVQAVFEMLSKPIDPPAPIRIGMGSSEVSSSAGPPLSVHEWREGGNLYHIWEYDSQRVWYHNGRVVRVQNK